MKCKGMKTRRKNTKWNKGKFNLKVWQIINISISISIHRSWSFKKNWVCFYYQFICIMICQIHIWVFRYLRFVIIKNYNFFSDQHFRSNLKTYLREPQKLTLSSLSSSLSTHSFDRVHVFSVLYFYFLGRSVLNVQALSSA